MPKTLEDGSVIWAFPDTFTDVLLNGTSVMALEPVEVKIFPDGFGWVSTKRDFNNPTAAPKKWIDGQTKFYFYRGRPTVTP